MHEYILGTFYIPCERPNGTSDEVSFHNSGTGVFCEFFKIFKNTFFAEHLPATASGYVIMFSKLGLSTTGSLIKTIYTNIGSNT